MSLTLPLPPIPKTDKQKYYQLKDISVGQRFVGFYKGVHTQPTVEHEMALLDGQIVFLEGCRALHQASKVLKAGDLVAVVYQGLRSYMDRDDKERKAPAFDVYLLKGLDWIPTYILARQS